MLMKTRQNFHENMKMPNLKISKKELNMRTIPINTREKIEKIGCNLFGIAAAGFHNTVT